MRKEVLVHRKNSRSPRHELFRENSPTSPSKLTANGGESDLINRLTAPTSSSAAKSKSQNRKTDGRKPERNKFLTTTLIPTTGGNNKAKEVSPIKLKSEPYRFPKLETSSIPTLKMSMMEKRSETTLSKTRQKYIIKPTNTFKRKSEIGKEKHEHSIIPQHTHLSEDQKLETNPQTTLGSTTQDRKSEQRIKRIKTANDVALPEAARGLLNKDNANKRVLHLLQLPQQEMRFEWGTMCFQLLLRGYHQGIYRKLIQTKKATFLKRFCNLGQIVRFFVEA